MSEPAFDLAAAHRWFAIEFNNAAWDLVESAGRSPEEAERMLHLAHAACLHWLEAGKPVNHMRALSLLAHAHACAGSGRLAVGFARRCAEIGLELDNQTPFDRAGAASAMACALRADGQLHDAQTWESKARQLAAELEDDDRQVIERLLNLVC